MLIKEYIIIFYDMFMYSLIGVGIKRWDLVDVPLVVQEPLSNYENETVVVHNLQYSGLSEQESKKIFIRNECNNLWNFCATRSEQLLLVEGAPGIGKSVEVFAYTMWKATKMNQRVIFIHADIMTEISIIFKEDCNSNSFRYSTSRFKKKPQYLLDFILGQLNANAVDLLVLDGALPWLILKIYLKLHRYPTVTCITSTSFQSLPDLPTEVTAACKKPKTYLMKSWTFEDLLAAQTNDALKIQTDTLEEIYYYSGGSIRFAQFKIEKLIGTIQTKIKSCADIGKVIGQGGA